MAKMQRNKDFESEGVKIVTIKTRIASFRQKIS